MKRRRAQGAVKWVLTTAALVAVLTAGGYAALRYMRPVVIVTEAVEGPVVQAFYSTGTVQPEREYPIKSNGPGIVTEIKVDKGSRVKKGEALAIVSAPELQFAVDKAQAEVTEKTKRANPKTSPVIQEFTTKIAAANEIFEIAQREQKCVEDLAKRDAASQSDTDRSLERLKQAWGDLESLKSAVETKKLELEKDLDVAKSALSTAQWNLQQQTLRSPIDGVVLDRPVSIGTRLAINDPLMRVANVSPKTLLMRAAVDEEDVAKVSVQQTVRMTLYSFADRTFVGKVLRIYDQADPERRTFEVDVQMTDPPDRLAPGMTGELAFIMDTRDRAVVIPSQAVQNGDVFSVQDNQLVRLNTKIGLRSVERTEVISGVRPGDRVVISSVGTLNNGQLVRTEFKDPQSAAGMNKPKQTNDGFKGFN